MSGVFCSSCKSIMNPKPVERAVEGYSAIFEVGHECGSCGHFTHSCFTSNALKDYADKIMAIREAKARSNLALVSRLSEIERIETQKYSTKFLRLNRRFEIVFKLSPIFSAVTPTAAQVDQLGAKITVNRATVNRANRANRANQEATDAVLRS